MLALGIIFFILGSCGLSFHLIIVLSVTYNLETFMREMQQPYSIIFYISIIFIILGILFIVLANKKKKQKLIQKQNEIKEQQNLQNEINKLKQKELELNILKENNLILNNKPKFCKYCGAKLKDNKCSACGAYTKED